MLNIVVYGEDDTFMRDLVYSVKASLFNYGLKYQIKRYIEYDIEMERLILNHQRKIYILDRDSAYSGLEVARIIRENDYDSVIVVVSRDRGIFFYNSVIDLDFKFVLKMISEILVLANENEEIVKYDKVFTFEYNRVVYRIPFKDITYIEKESNVKRCIIHTINNKYYITSSLKAILEQLGNKFYRTHQSCIVNLSNIKEIELGNNMVVFKNGVKIDMVTGKTKKELKKYIGIS